MRAAPAGPHGGAELPDAADRLRGPRIVLAHLAWMAAIIDSVQTYVGLRWLGTGEGSPAVRRLIVTLGLGPGVVVRTVIASGLVWLLWVGVRKSPELQVLGLGVVAGLHTWVVGTNLRLIMQVA